MNKNNILFQLSVLGPQYFSRTFEIPNRILTKIRYQPLTHVYILHKLLLLTSLKFDIYTVKCLKVMPRQHLKFLKMSTYL